MVELRIANEKDLLKIFQWRNTDFVKRLGSLDRKVRIEEPTKWFKSSLKDPNCKILSSVMTIKMLKKSGSINIKILQQTLFISQKMTLGKVWNGGYNKRIQFNPRILKGYLWRVGFC